MSQTSPQLIDRFGRVHDNLRISVTDRCNIRCFYCMPEENVVFMKRQELLTFEEIERFVRISTKLGIRKVRLTGGEPLVRRDLHKLVAQIVAVDGIDDVALTTNGILLADQAEALFDAGLRRINIHIDTLDPERFREITRRDGVDRVLQGIARCRELGFDPIKINAVAARNSIEEDIVPLGRFSREYGLEVRFIEYMPLDAANAWERGRVLFADEILDRLAREVAPLVPALQQDPRAPATEYLFEDQVGKIGIIASVSKPFCASCNRIRLTAEGKIRNCLFSHEEFDVKTLLRSQADDSEIMDVVKHAVDEKWEGHEINTSRFIQPARPMYAIGG